jgi:hypothetical protein
MLISVVNRTKMHDEEVQTVVRAVNRQLADDFEFTEIAREPASPGA